MSLEFNGKIWFWKGPAPHFFVTVPEDECLDLKAASSLVTYGWGMIPVRAQIGQTVWKTSLFPKNGQYYRANSSKRSQSRNARRG
jgi:hypothetical protein